MMEEIMPEETVVEEQMVVLGDDDYKNLLRCLNILKESCNDADIVNGVIRQRSDDLSVLIEIDLRGVLEELSIPLTNLKQKTKLIEYFSDEVSISMSDESDIKIVDSYSSIKFTNAGSSFVDNPFVDDNEFADIFPLNQDELILECELSEILVERIKTTIQHLNIFRVDVLFDGNNAVISTKSQSGDNIAKFLETETNQNIECETSMMPTAFLADADDSMKISIFRDPNSETMSYHKFELNIGDIEINIYARSTLRSIQDD
jgi:hypothetical protein